MDHLRVVLHVLKEHKLFAKCSKCMFWLRSVASHGHIISSARVKVDLMKTKAVKNWTRPLAPTDIRSFLGLVGYNRRFVDGFCVHSFPLTTLTQKSVKFDWSEACKEFSKFSKIGLPPLRY